MSVNWKHLYRYIKKMLGFKNDDYWDDNPFVVL
jgi:hypothetical protein